jgi:putative endonuclease
LLHPAKHAQRNEGGAGFAVTRKGAGFMAVGREYCVYIMTNAHNTVLYTGVTNNLARRVYEHKNGLGSAFTKKYNANKLVYYEAGNSIHSAIAREKQIKGGSRKKKVDLINSLNPEWKDLYEEILS